MKVTIISAFCPPEKGAAPYRILNTAKEIKKGGINVEIITTLANYPKGKLFKGYRWRIYKKDFIEGIMCRRLWLYPSNSNNPFLRILSMCSYGFSLVFTIPRLLISKPDALIVQSPPLLSAFIATLIGKLLKIKIFLNVSDVWPLTAAELGVISSKSKSFRLFSYIEKKMYKNSDFFVAQSNDTIKYLNGHSDKPKFLYRNLTIQKIEEEENANCGERLRLVYAGLLGLAQGVYKICKYFDINNLDIELHIYGDGIERPLIEDYISNNNILNIHLYDPVPKEDIQEILRGYDATIIPLTTEILGAYPSKISMAISARLPIFFAGGGEGARDILKFGIGYVSSPGDVNGLLSNIKKYMKMDLDSKEILINNLNNVAENEFNYSIQQKTFLKFLNEHIK